MVDYHITVKDNKKGKEVRESLLDLFPEDTSEVWSFNQRGDVRSTLAGIAGVVHRIYEIESGGVIMTREPMILPGRGYAGGVGLYGFPPGSDTYQRLVDGLEELGFKEMLTTNGKIDIEMVDIAKVLEKLSEK